MHEEVLSKEQKDLLPLVKSFSDNFGLIGGTAVALQLGHRRSNDFDLATFSNLQTSKIRDKIGKKYKIDSVIVDEAHEFTLVINEVKFTFLYYPFTFDLEVNFKDIIKLPKLVTLASMKAYALGRRAKWKDYVDIYFIANKHSFLEIVENAKKLYGHEFNEKLFREQLAYHQDIDYTEKIDYMRGFKVKDEMVKEKLIELSLQKK